MSRRYESDPVADWIRTFETVVTSVFEVVIAILMLDWLFGGDDA